MKYTLIYALIAFLATMSPFWAFWTSWTGNKAIITGFTLCGLVMLVVLPGVMSLEGRQK